MFFLGKHESIQMKENQSANSSKTLTNGWTEFSLGNKKSISGINIHHHKESPFNEVNVSIAFHF